MTTTENLHDGCICNVCKDAPRDRAGRIIGIGDEVLIVRPPSESWIAIVVRIDGSRFLVAAPTEGVTSEWVTADEVLLHPGGKAWRPAGWLGLDPASAPYVDEAPEVTCDHVAAVASSPCCGSLRRLMREHGIDAETFTKALGISTTGRTRPTGQLSAIPDPEPF